MTVGDVTSLIFLAALTSGFLGYSIGYDQGYERAKAKLTEQALAKMEAIVAAVKAHGEST